MNQCQIPEYPRPRRTMEMSSIDEIERSNAAILGTEVYRAQKKVAAKNLLNLILRLKFLNLSNDLNFLDHGLRMATLARRQFETLTHLQSERDSKYQVITTCLCLEVGRVFNNDNPYTLSAAILKPYISNEIYQGIVRFQEILNTDSGNNQLENQLKNWYIAAQKPDAESDSFSQISPYAKTLLWRDIFLKPVPEDKAIPS